MPRPEDQTIRLVEAQGVLSEPGVFREEALRLFSEGDAPDVPRELREALLLRPGRFNGWEFTEADLREMESAFDPDQPPPLQLDHSKSARDTYGFLRAVRYQDGWLRGLVEYSGEEAVTRFRAGHWRKLSLGIRLPGAAGRKAGARKRIEECSITPFPAVGGDEPARVLTERSPDMPEETHAEPAAETTPASIPEATEALEETTEEQPAEEAAAMSGREPADEEKAILSDLEARLARLEAENREKDRLLRLREDADLLVRLCASGKSLPAMKERELAFLQTLSADQRAAWVELKEASPAYVRLGGRQTAPDTHRPGTESRSDLEAQVAELTALAREKGLARS